MLLRDSGMEKPEEHGILSPVCAGKPGFPGEQLCLSPKSRDPPAPGGETLPFPGPATPPRPASIPRAREPLLSPRDSSQTCGLRRPPYSGASNFHQPRASGLPPEPGTPPSSGPGTHSARGPLNPRARNAAAQEPRTPQPRAAHPSPPPGPLRTPLTSAPPPPLLPPPRPLRALPGAGPAYKGVVCA